MAEADAKDAAHQLLDLEAGSSDSEDQLPEAQYLVDDEGAVYFADAILTSLEEERNSFQQTVKDSQGRRCEGLRACARVSVQSFYREAEAFETSSGHIIRLRISLFVRAQSKLKSFCRCMMRTVPGENMQFSYLQRSAEYIRAQVRPPALSQAESSGSPCAAVAHGSRTNVLQ